MYIMDNQTLYNEVMAKLAEAQNCQTEIINCNNELQKIYSMGVYDLQSYYRLMPQSQEIVRRQYDWIRQRDDKLNEALSKALDIVVDEIDKNIFNLNSLGPQALGNIFGFMELHNIRIQYSAEVQAKLTKITAKGLGLFPFNISWFGW